MIWYIRILPIWNLNENKMNNKRHSKDEKEKKNLIMIIFIF